MSWVNDVTLIVLVAIWPVWLVWEMVLLVKRGAGINVKTISMVARDRGWHLSSVVYTWNGLASHWWVNTPERSATMVGSIVFWLVSATLLIQDMVLWPTLHINWPKWLRWQRYPALVMGIGLAAGWILFPQRGETP